MAGSDRNGQRVDAGFFHEALCFIGIGQQLIVGQRSDCTVAVFLFAATIFERSEATEFAFDADAASVCHLHDFGGDFDVVVVVGWGLTVSFE